MPCSQRETNVFHLVYQHVICSNATTRALVPTYLLYLNITDLVLLSSISILVILSKLYLFALQYVALFPGHPYFRTLRVYDSVFRFKNETNPNDTFRRLID